MNTSTISHKFKMGERVNFDSPSQHETGAGTVYGVTLYADGSHEYLIELDGGGDVVPGILEDEITPAATSVMSELVREFARFAEVWRKPGMARLRAMQQLSQATIGCFAESERR